MFAAVIWPRESDSRASPPPSTASAGVKPEVSRYSGLVLPRFVTLKTSKVNVRRGPSRKHSIAWSFTKKGLPVEIIRESENWRMIRDSEGSEGWIYQGLLSGKRAAIIAPWQEEGVQNLYSRPGKETKIVAQLEPGVVSSVKQCNGAWCKIEGNGFDGWVTQGNVWGVYPDEVFE